MDGFCGWYMASCWEEEPVTIITMFARGCCLQGVLSEVHPL